MADNSSARIVFLHGDLFLKIIEARNLPNMDVVTGHILRCVPFDSCPEDKSPPGTDDLKLRSSGRKIIASDPYVKVSVPQAAVARTRVLKNSKNPRWDERFKIPLAHELVYLEFEVKDDDIFGADLIGTVSIRAHEIATGNVISDWFPLKNSRKDSQLRLEMKFVSCDKNPLYRHGIAGDPDLKGVRDTYFPVRKGSQVTLYQDAHIRPESKMPKIELEGGKAFEHNSCWEDICHAISSAHHMIYIVGWSVFHKIKLIREPNRPLPRGGELTLGELLKYKSEEGVRVLLLVWDDKTSHSKLFVNTNGVMQTHDEETRKFFKHSSVQCVLSPRYGSSKLGLFKQQVVGGAFTHHQKCVLVDTQAYGNNRKISAFIGGLDLCDGRYDTPEHRLFHDLDTIFKDDVHQPTIPVGTRAPRQPWHDLHCKIDGPAAYDVLLNFEQRWRKATRWREFALIAKRMAHYQDDALLKIDRISWIDSPTNPTPITGDHTVVPEDDPLIHVTTEDDPDNWHVQIFRSIDSGSLKGFPKTVDVAEAQNLITAKSMVIDKSIQTAYIQAIRSAQHFIYIENQYFIGSSYAWSYENAGADNLIPMELAQKIASKIRSKERFAVYVVIPMWPEGIPTSATVQEILYWQSQTMQMMYNVVAQAIKSMQLDAHPQDYLNFYCLGKREEVPFRMNPSSADDKFPKYSQKFKRFMIYVHAKGMIVDDEYVIIGSANINQRSLAGSKDTEIAMGSYQPHHTWAAKKRHPYGQVYGYRMSLWAEQLGLRTLEKPYKEPETLECVKIVNKIAEDNWKRYTDENFRTLQGHLLRYPLQVDAGGNVNFLPGYENFPDVGGKVMGAHSPTLPDILTT
ncbi:phospholipase D delta isoform X4 [Cynara cardunculus var. scolymus]|uniref:phospholipase D delta isoform X4 n=1 Tax=Cynara cardunculus var. scolymus TaxID=59895 RepID=UPI000D625827|nr:phospholipase D delta isoform X4 [Cynara cardunculus var. scolymus]